MTLNWRTALGVGKGFLMVGGWECVGFDVGVVVWCCFSFWSMCDGVGFTDDGEFGAG